MNNQPVVNKKQKSQPPQGSQKLGAILEQARSQVKNNNPQAIYVKSHHVEGTEADNLAIETQVNSHLQTETAMETGEVHKHSTLNLKDGD